MDQHRLADAQPAALDQGCPSGRACAGQHARLRMRQIPRPAGHDRLVDDMELGKAPAAERRRSLVWQTQDAVRWLSTSIACLDEDSREAPAAITDALARLLVVRVFADAACTSSE